MHRPFLKVGSKISRGQSYCYMRPTLVQLANALSKAPPNLNEASAMLYLPIPLYRRLLRAHRNLPTEMRTLGDVYIKSGAAFSAAEWYLNLK